MGPVDDADRVQRPVAVLGPDPVGGVDHEAVDAEQAVELDVVAGLLAHLADGRGGGVLARVDAAAGQRPAAAVPLAPVGEEHPAVLADDHGVGGDTGLHGPIMRDGGHRPGPSSSTSSSRRDTSENAIRRWRTERL
ncbi:Uncharacterised protein [Mycobacteroides abscessus]|nr:Uncharacterised protein [Mycobacteroides abscessus]